MKDGEITTYHRLLCPATVAVIGASTNGTGCRTSSSGASASSATRARSIRSIRQPRRSTACPLIAASPTRRSRSITRYIAIPARADSRPARARGRRPRALRAGDLERLRRSREGKTLQERLVAAAREGGMRLIGPNCLGIYTPRGKITFTEIGAERSRPGRRRLAERRPRHRHHPPRHEPRPQASRARHRRQLRRRGAERPARVLSRRSQTRVIGLYIETARDGRRLFEILREARARKPVVMLKGGRTQPGPRGGRFAHGLARRRRMRAWVALSRQTGCVLVDTLDQFIDTLLIFQTLTPQPRIRRSASRSSATAAARACSRPITTRGSVSTWRRSSAKPSMR